MGTLDGKVAIVTGAGRGIGRAVAMKLAAHGALIVINDLDEEPANEVSDAIRAAGEGPSPASAASRHRIFASVSCRPQLTALARWIWLSTMPVILAMA